MDFLFVYLFLLLLLASDYISFSHSSNSSKEFKSVVCVALLATFLQKKSFSRIDKKIECASAANGRIANKTYFRCVFLCVESASTYALHMFVIKCTYIKFECACVPACVLVFCCCCCCRVLLI